MSKGRKPIRLVVHKNSGLFQVAAELERLLGGGPVEVFYARPGGGKKLGVVYAPEGIGPMLKAMVEEARKDERQGRASVAF